MELKDEYLEAACREMMEEDVLCNYSKEDYEYIIIPKEVERKVKRNNYAVKYFGADYRRIKILGFVASIIFIVSSILIFKETDTVANGERFWEKIIELDEENGTEYFHIFPTEGYVRRYQAEFTYIPEGFYLDEERSIIDGVYKFKNTKNQSFTISLFCYGDIWIGYSGGMKSIRHRDVEFGAREDEKYSMIMWQDDNTIEFIRAYDVYFSVEELLKIYDGIVKIYE